MARKRKDEHPDLEPLTATVLDLIKLLETAKVELADVHDDELREALGILKGHVSFVYAPLRGESVIRAYLLVSHALSEKLLSGE